MAYIAPDSIVKICMGVEYTPDYKHTLTWSDATAQMAYIETKTVYTLENYTYVSDNSINVELTKKQLENCNYIAYKNNKFENKWKFGFIKRTEYVNNVTTQILFDEDILQTWFFDVNRLPCFISREHTPTDNWNEHLENEEFELGEYVFVEQRKLINNSMLPVIISGLNITYDPSTQQATVEKISHRDLINYPNALFEGVTFVVCDSIRTCGYILDAIQTAGFQDAVMQICAVESSYVASVIKNTSLVGGITAKLSIEYLPNNASPLLFGGYKPKNNKLYQSPFRYFIITNGQGQIFNGKFEMCGNPDKLMFECYWAFEGNPTSIMFLKNYKNLGTNTIDKMVCGNYPVSAYANDTYKTWWAQNSVLYEQELKQKGRETGLSTGKAIADALIKTGALAALGGASSTALATLGSSSAGIASAVGSLTTAEMNNGFTSIVSSMMDYQNLTERQLAQSQSAQVNSVNVNYTSSSICEWLTNSIGFSVYYMSITREFAKKIDDYFSMYGYKINSVGIPDIMNRQSWNYVKTIGASFTGNVPSYVLEKFTQIFDNGVTFWHVPYRVGDYTLPNGIV